MQLTVGFTGMGGATVDWTGPADPVREMQLSSLSSEEMQASGASSVFQVETQIMNFYMKFPYL